MQSFKRRKTEGKACCFLHVACGGGACETSVSGFCRSGRIFAALVRLGECEVFASELALAEACAGPKIGAARRPQIWGRASFLATKSGPGERRSQKDYGGVAACECLRATPLSILQF